MNRRKFPHFDRKYEKPITKNHAKQGFIERFTVRTGKR